MIVALDLACAWFRDRPQVQSLTVAFTQWCTDEALDAVEEIVVESTERDPPWISRGVVFPGRGSDVHVVRQAHGLHSCDENSTLIVAFASCCAEGPGQGCYMPDPTPWAIARRGSDGAADIEVIGRILRPWWEDRWDVGFHRGPDSPGWNPPEPVLDADNP